MGPLADQSHATRLEQGASPQLSDGPQLLRRAVLAQDGLHPGQDLVPLGRQQPRRSAGHQLGLEGRGHGLLRLVHQGQPLPALHQEPAPLQGWQVPGQDGHRAHQAVAEARPLRGLAAPVALSQQEEQAGPLAVLHAGVELDGGVGQGQLVGADGLPGQGRRRGVRQLEQGQVGRDLAGIQGLDGIHRRGGLLVSPQEVEAGQRAQGHHQAHEEADDQEHFGPAPSPGNQIAVRGEFVGHGGGGSGDWTIG